MSCIHYKFKSSLEYRTVTFEGLHLALNDLKRMIFDRERIRCSDFDLLITDAQSSEIYDGENAVVLRNSSVVVARIPVENQRKLPKIWDRASEGVVPKAVHSSESTSSAVQKIIAYSESLTEEEKLRKMEEESTIEYDPSMYVKKNAVATGVPPPNYVCNRCNQPGHWIKLCPSLNIKRTTGIPKGELMETTADDPQAMLTASGTYAVPVLHKQAFLKGKSEKPISKATSLEEGETKRPDIPNELLCTICNGVLKDASLIPCCGYSFCDECIRHSLLESEERECPNCHAQRISPTNLIPNGKLREAVKAMQEQHGVEEAAPKATCSSGASGHSQAKLKISFTSPQRVGSVESSDRAATSLSPHVDSCSADEMNLPTVSPTPPPPMQPSFKMSTLATSVTSAMPTAPLIHPQNAPFPPLYSGMIAASLVPAGHFVPSFGPVIPSMGPYGPPGLSLHGYNRAVFPSQPVAPLMSVYGNRVASSSMLRQYPNGLPSIAASKTGVDSWDEFLARQDRRRHRERSSSSSSAESRDKRTRRNWRSPERRRYYVDEKERARESRRYAPKSLSSSSVYRRQYSSTSRNALGSYGARKGPSMDTGRFRHWPSAQKTSEGRRRSSEYERTERRSLSGRSGSKYSKGSPSYSKVGQANVGNSSTAAADSADSALLYETEDSIYYEMAPDDLNNSSGSPKFLEMDSINIDDMEMIVTETAAASEEEAAFVVERALSTSSEPEEPARSEELVVGMAHGEQNDSAHNEAPLFNVAKNVIDVEERSKKAGVGGGSSRRHSDTADAKRSNGHGDKKKSSSSKCQGQKEAEKRPTGSGVESRSDRNSGSGQKKKRDRSKERQRTSSPHVASKSSKRAHKASNAAVAGKESKKGDRHRPKSPLKTSSKSATRHSSTRPDKSSSGKGGHHHHHSTRAQRDHAPLSKSKTTKSAAESTNSGHKAVTSSADARGASQKDERTLSSSRAFKRCHDSPAGGSGKKAFGKSSTKPNSVYTSSSSLRRERKK